MLYNSHFIFRKVYTYGVAQCCLHILLVPQSLLGTMHTQNENVYYRDFLIYFTLYLLIILYRSHVCTGLCERGAKGSSER